MDSNSNENDNKRLRDVKEGWKRRLSLGSFLNGNGENSILLLPVHPYLTNLTPKERLNFNTVYNRLVSSMNGKNMGLDFDLTSNKSIKKTRVIIRWNTDPDIFIKDVSERDLQVHYKDAILLITDKPNKAGKIKYYRIFPFSYFEKMGWMWVEANNENRIRLYTKSGKIIKPSHITLYPVDGGISIFDSTPSIWKALEQFCI